MHELQKCVIKLEDDHDDLEQYGCCFCVHLEDMPVEKGETADKVFSKTENILKEAYPNLSCDCIDCTHLSGATINVIKPTRNATVS